MKTNPLKVLSVACAMIAILITIKTSIRNVDRRNDDEAAIVSAAFLRHFDQMKSSKQNGGWVESPACDQKNYQAWKP